MGASVVVVVGACVGVMEQGSAEGVSVVVVTISVAVPVVSVGVVVLMVLEKATVVDGPVAVVNVAIGSCCGGW